MQMARVLLNIRKHRKLLGGISIPTISRSTASYSSEIDCSLSTTPPSPIMPPWHVSNFYMSPPHRFPHIFDEIRDESLHAICCFHGANGYGYKHAYVIIQNLLEQYPHVQTFHFIMDWDYENGTHDEDEMRESDISSVPGFHFYQNGKKVVELDGNYITRFKKVLQKLYKPLFTSAHNRETNQEFYRDSKNQGTRQSSPRIFSTSGHSLEFNQQYHGERKTDKIQGRANFELILSEELVYNRVLDANTPMVLCFANYPQYTSYFVYWLLRYTFSERFPHVSFCYVLLAPKEDDYETTLDNVKVSSLAYKPTLRFFKDGRRVAEVAHYIENANDYCRKMERIFEKIYNTEHTMDSSGSAQELQNKDGKGVGGQRGRKLKKELDCSLSLEDIIKNAGIVHIGNVDMNSVVKSPSAPSKGNIQGKFWTIWQQISDQCRKLW